MKKQANLKIADILKLSGFTRKEWIGICAGLVLILLILTFAGLTQGLMTEPELKQVQCDVSRGELTSKLGPALGARLHVAETTLSPEEIARLEKAICSSLLSASRIAQEQGMAFEWMKDLPVEVRPDRSGLDGEFNQGLLDWDFRAIRVDAGVVVSAPDDVLLWFLGHELGHGVMRHARIDQGIQSLGLCALLVAFGIFFFAKYKMMPEKSRKVMSFLSGTLLCMGLFLFFLGKPFLSMNQEFAADAFGVRVAAGAGVPLAEAQLSVSKYVARYGGTGGSLFSLKAIQANIHPSGEQRRKAIEGLK